MNPLAGLRPLVVHTEPQAKMFMRLGKESGIKRTWKVVDGYFNIYHAGGLLKVKTQETANLESSA